MDDVPHKVWRVTLIRSHPLIKSCTDHQLHKHQPHMSYCVHCCIYLIEHMSIDRTNAYLILTNGSCFTLGWKWLLWDPDLETVTVCTVFRTKTHCKALSSDWIIFFVGIKWIIMFVNIQCFNDFKSTLYYIMLNGTVILTMLLCWRCFSRNVAFRLHKNQLISDHHLQLDLIGLITSDPDLAEQKKLILLSFNQTASGSTLNC